MCTNAMAGADPPYLVGVYTSGNLSNYFRGYRQCRKTINQHDQDDMEVEDTAGICPTYI